MENNLVTLSNTLIQASYTLDTVEIKLISALISSIDNNITSLETIDSNTFYTISAKDYADLYGIKIESAKDELSKAVDKLFTRDVRYIDKNGAKVRTRWIASTVEYDKITHSISIAWAIGIIPLISELRTNFTSYKMRFLSALSSIYSIRWYEILVMELSKSQKSEVSVEISISTIRTMFELHNKYSLFADFAKRVIDTPLKEINISKMGNINVSIVDREGRKLYIKEGKKVVGIRFRIWWRDRECSHVEKKKREAYLKRVI